MFKPNIYI